MSRRIHARDVAGSLEDDGHPSAEYDGGDWDPGHRTAQHGPRIVHVFHDAPGEAAQLLLYTTTLRADGYHVQHEQQNNGGRHRLAVTRP